MKFIKNAEIKEVAVYLADAINSQLASGEQVLWLLSGGSSITVAVAAQKLVTPGRLKDVSVTLADERYGQPGHAGSNWQQLRAAGFDFAVVRSLAVLQGNDVQQTKADFETMLAAEMSSGKFVVGLFGIGTDGHTAGILPGSPAVDSQQLASVYQGPDFQRITITGRAIQLVNLAVAYATGDAKRQALLKLQQQDLSIREQPAQALKLAKKAIIFNDQTGDSI